MSDTADNAQVWSIIMQGVVQREVGVNESVIIGRKPLRPLPDEGVPRLDIRDATRSMSKRHALFSVNSEGVALIRDLHSTNGTFIVRDNGDLSRMPYGQDFVFPRSEIRLQLGDVVVDFRQSCAKDTNTTPTHTAVIREETLVSLASDEQCGTNAQSDNLADNKNVSRNVQDLFTYAPVVGTVQEREYSVDDILTIRSGDPTEALSMKKVEQQVRSKREERLRISNFALLRKELQEQEEQRGDNGDEVLQQQAESLPALTPGAGAMWERSAQLVSENRDGQQLAEQLTEEPAPQLTQPQASVVSSEPIIPPEQQKYMPVQSAAQHDAALNAGDYANAEMNSHENGNIVPSQISTTVMTSMPQENVSIVDPTPSNELNNFDSADDHAAEYSITAVPGVQETQPAPQSIEEQLSQPLNLFQDAATQVYQGQELRSQSSIENPTIPNSIPSLDDSLPTGSFRTIDQLLNEPLEQPAHYYSADDQSLVVVQDNSANQASESVVELSNTVLPLSDNTATGIEEDQIIAENAVNEPVFAQNTNDFANYDSSMSTVEETNVHQTSMYNESLPQQATAIPVAEDTTSVFAPVYEPGSVFERLKAGSLQVHQPAVEINGYNSDDAQVTADYSVQFEMAKYRQLLPFLAMNPHLYSDLFTWLAALGDPDINEALQNNKGYMNSASTTMDIQ